MTIIEAVEPVSRCQIKKKKSAELVSYGKIMKGETDSKSKNVMWHVPNFRSLSSVCCLTIKAVITCARCLEDIVGDHENRIPAAETDKQLQATQQALVQLYESIAICRNHIRWGNETFR